LSQAIIYLFIWMVDRKFDMLDIAPGMCQMTGWRAGVAVQGVAWSMFTVKPLLASLKFVNATVPTIRGPIVVAATPESVMVDVPCNTQATLCVQVCSFLSTQVFLRKCCAIQAIPRGQTALRVRACVRWFVRGCAGIAEESQW
jgi:hypothetical protein